jgi:OHCU decarboxylase
VTPELERFNALPAGEAEARLSSCCASSEWTRRMAAARPFGSFRELADEADRVWRSLSREDWLEAFAAHPPIGAAGTGPAGLHPPPNSEKDAGGERFRALSREEQGGTRGASPETLANLADANRDYEERFGHIFIVCASGRNAAEMLALAEKRLGNDRATELAIAAEEQRKITRLRLEKLLAATHK